MLNNTATQSDPGPNKITASESLIKQHRAKVKCSPQKPDIAQAAQDWFRFGFPVVPIDPGKKSPAVRWEPWLKDLNEEKITTHFQRHPGDELGVIVDDRFFILDADTQGAVARLYEIENAFDLEPTLVVSTSKGEHHYYRRALGTYAKMDSFSTENDPEKIDVRTARSRTEGRSIVVLPPSTNKSIKLKEADNIGELVEVGQDFIDAIFRHNGKEAPRPQVQRVRERNPEHRTPREDEAAAVLSRISPDCGYDDWMKVLMGLHDKFQGNDTGLRLADEWSRGGSDYPGSEEIEYKWRSFTANKSDGVTFGTVLTMAGDELLASASEMNEKTAPEEIRTVVEAAAFLPSNIAHPIKEALKKNAKVSFGRFDAAAKEKKGYNHKDLARACFDDDLITAESGTYHYNGGIWRETGPQRLRKLVQDTLDREGVRITNNLVIGVVACLKSESYLPDHRFNVGDPETINCLNGELTLIKGKWVQRPHTREHYRTSQIPVRYDPNATAPRFSQFLGEIFHGDSDVDDKIQALLEIMGYSLMAHCRHEKFIILVGNGANGKSVLLSLLEALCGTENIAAVQPGSLERGFYRAQLRNKLVNIVTEIKQGELIDDAALKGIVSGEPTEVEEKFKAPYLLRPYVTGWFGTNHMPSTRDYSDALFRRALVLEFNNTFKPGMDGYDPKLKDKLIVELPGVLNLVLGAYAKALRDGFTEPASSAKAKCQWRLESDQVRQYVEEECKRDAKGKVMIQDLFNDYRRWADDNGVRHRLSKNAFSRRLSGMGFIHGRGNRGRFVSGITMVEHESF